MTNRIIAVIGTAGRDKTIRMTMRHWDFMYQTLLSELQPGDHLVSGGAAWADHVAVMAFLNKECSNLTLHLPAPFHACQFVGERGTSGAASNYYHEKFSKVLNDYSMEHISKALRSFNCSWSTQPVSQGYSAMAARNARVADDCTHMLAFTFGKGDVPTDGGTRITWDMAKGKQRVHIPIPL